MIAETFKPVTVTEKLRSGHVPQVYLEKDLRSDEADAYAEQVVADGRGLYLYGPNGVGKTHLAAGILASVVERTGADVGFVSAVDLMMMIRSRPHSEGSDDDEERRRREAEARRLRTIRNVPVLVLDDFDKAAIGGSSDYMHEQLFGLIDARYSSKSPTIVTANCKVSELCKGFRDQILARSVSSRFFEMMEQLEMDGKDRRLVPDDGASEEVPQRWYIPESIGCSFECEEARQDQDKRRRDDAVGFPYRCPNRCTDFDGRPSTLVPLFSDDSTETVFCCSICHEVMTTEEAHETHLHETEPAGAAR